MNIRWEINFVARIGDRLCRSIGRYTRSSRADFKMLIAPLSLSLSLFRILIRRLVRP